MHEVRGTSSPGGSVECDEVEGNPPVGEPNACTEPCEHTKSEQAYVRTYIHHQLLCGLAVVYLLDQGTGEISQREHLLQRTVSFPKSISPVLTQTSSIWVPPHPSQPAAPSGCAMPAPLGPEGWSTLSHQSLPGAAALCSSCSWKGEREGVSGVGEGGCQWGWRGSWRKEGVSGVGEGVEERRVSVELGRELRKGGCQWSWGGS